MAFHINNRGEAHECSAQEGNCPFGGLEAHYSSTEQARVAFEASMAGEYFKSHSKLNTALQAKLPGWSWDEEVDGAWVLSSEDSNTPNGDGFAMVAPLSSGRFKVSVMDTMGEVLHEDAIGGLDDARLLATDLMAGNKNGEW